MCPHLRNPFIIIDGQLSVQTLKMVDVATLRLYNVSFDILEQMQHSRGWLMRLCFGLSVAIFLLS